MRNLASVALAGLTLSCASLFPGIPGLGYLNTPDLGDAAGFVAELDQRCSQLDREDVTYEEEVSLGGAVALHWASREGGLFIDAVQAPTATPADLAMPKNAVNLYVATVGRNLAFQSERPALDWAFGVVDAPVFNAYSAPGGYVMVSRGLLQKVQNEAQLAGVLAHEIAHITQKHGVGAYKKLRGDKCRGAVAGDRLSRQLSPLTQAFSQVGAMGGLDLSQNSQLLAEMTGALVQNLLNHGFDAAQEHEADQLAVELVARAGYNPYEYVAFLGEIPEGGDNFGKHPSKASRQEKLRAVLAQLEQDELLAANGRKLNEYPKVPLTTELAAVR
ncbi:MAG: M48 family metallopeptidase [Myxococcota bacterium]|nr:M48 family metallopeptidase [Myxococcota bacterium]